MKDLLSRWWQQPDFQSLLDGLRLGRGTHVVHGLVPGVDTFLEAALFQELDRTLVVICEGLKEAARIQQDVSVWCQGTTPLIFPPLESMPQVEGPASPDVVAARLAVFEALRNGAPSLIIVPMQALDRRLPAPVDSSAEVLLIRRGRMLEMEWVLRQLERFGYRRSSLVEGPGQWSSRGGIVDVYPPTHPQPIRIEFFGDEVDSIRSFDPGSQRSEANIESIRLEPAAEGVSGDPAEVKQQVQQAMEAELASTLHHLEATDDTRAAARLRERIHRQVDALEQGLQPLHHDWYRPYASDLSATLLDYAPTGTGVILWDPDQLERGFQGRQRENIERRERWLKEGQVLPSQATLERPWSLEELTTFAGARVFLMGLLRRVGTEGVESLLRISSRSPEVFYGQWDMFRGELHRWRDLGRDVVLVVPTAARQRGLTELFGEAVSSVREAPLSRGFELPHLDLIVITEEEVSGRGHRRRYQLAGGSRGSALTHSDDLQEGDYVVHRYHGVGQYLGLVTREVAEVEREYMLLRYAEGDRLYVPVEAIDQVHRYGSADMDPPRVYRLGSGDWARLKARVRQSVKDMTEELIHLYAARNAQPGFAFPMDTRWQQDFEEGFPYEDTVDQAQATEEIKAAMEEGRPMDYLLCGDVGYGKTEVALRAAFKAISASKQVALLVPTTILAQQHYETACQRFSGWPIEVGLLSRFRSAKQQEATITDLRRGRVDLVIGTHRLLGRDVQFKDLGLIIVDEEHRFGVGHKERLKQLKSYVDVLTLSATPIPRTLHMALSGIRSLSLIETPPEDRLPVSTYVTEYDGLLIKDALLRELDRGGQVFYVHNRVRSIERARQRVEQLVPNAQVAVAHGQMPEHQLEQVMHEFVRGDYDVLVCTTIIESGLDIPNVNTLVVEDADRMGLAQLYQLRGRVGRSDRLAYAYFTYRSGEVLDINASRRLRALEEFHSLGAGFRLAKRDLELRGAGNVLGAEQHGFMLAVGFDLYAQFLEEAVAELQGEAVIAHLQPTLEAPVDAYLPSDYVSSSTGRIDLYRRIQDAGAPEAQSDVLDELIDRFGDPPSPALNLLTLARLRWMAARRGITSLVHQGSSLTLDMLFYEGRERNWLHWGQTHQLRASITRSSSRLQVVFRWRGDQARTPPLRLLEDLLQGIPEICEGEDGSGIVQTSNAPTN